MPARSQDAATLSVLLDGIKRVDASDDREITGLCLDSRQLEKGDCFVALSGANRHGAQYVRDAIEAGAAAILVEDVDVALDTATPIISVPGLRTELGRIASRFYGDPSAALDVIAVTGTNGKTTVAQLCAEAAKQLHGAAGYAGTLGIGRIGELRSTATTTPDPITLHGFFADLVERRCRVAAIEVSSHAIVQSRVAGTALDVVVFTNVGHDHLDYHDTLEAYVAAKKSLFQYPGVRHAVINIDDDVGGALVGELAPDVCCWTYGSRSGKSGVDASRHLSLTSFSTDMTGSRLIVATPQGEVAVTTPLIGDFNAQNLMASLGALMAIGFSADDAAACLSHAPGLPGRMEIVERKSDSAAVVVDYAHTPESLSRVLAALRPYAARRLICVFGCGGERDRSKRAPMGLAARSGADEIIVTSDNPRGEDNEAIVAQILERVSSADGVTVIHDRARAIEAAIDGAGPGDIVLIAGKGHESFQEIRGERYPFSDSALARRLTREPRP